MRADTHDGPEQMLHVRGIIPTLGMCDSRGIEPSRFPNHPQNDSRWQTEGGLPWAKAGRQQECPADSAITAVRRPAVPTPIAARTTHPGEPSANNPGSISSTTVFS